MEQEKLNTHLAMLHCLILLSGYESDKERQKEQQETIARFCRHHRLYPETSDITAVDPTRVFARIQDRGLKEEITGFLIRFTCGKEQETQQKKWIALARLLVSLRE